MFFEGEGFINCDTQIYEIFVVRNWCSVPYYVHFASSMMVVGKIDRIVFFPDCFLTLSLPNHVYIRFRIFTIGCHITYIYGFAGLSKPWLPTSNLYCCKSVYIRTRALRMKEKRKSTSCLNRAIAALSLKSIYSLWQHGFLTRPFRVVLDAF